MKVKEYTPTWHVPWKLSSSPRVPQNTWFRKGKPTPLAMKVYSMVQMELQKEKKKGAFVAKKKNAYSSVAEKLGLSGGEKIQIMCYHINKLLTKNV
jgi:hypothetical protein